MPTEVKLHVIVDNYSTHEHAKVKAWLTQRPRYHVHYTPKYTTWINQVERRFDLITQRTIRRCSFYSSQEPTAKIEQFMATYNKIKAPFN